MEDSAEYDFTFKIIVLGDPGVGKSCLTSRALKDKFEDKYAPTIGFEFLTYNAIIDSKIIKLQIWDTCGQEMYRSLIANFYRNASLAMMVYSINSKESFSHINTWIKEVKLQSHPDIKIILIGNKSDLEENRQVTIEEAKEFIKENEISFFQETSAKTGKNTKEVFEEAAKILYKDHLKYNIRAGRYPPKCQPCDLSFSDNTSVTSNSSNNIPDKKIKIVQRKNNICC